MRSSGSASLKMVTCWVMTGHGPQGGHLRLRQANGSGVRSHVERVTRVPLSFGIVDQVGKGHDWAGSDQVA